MAKSGSKTSPEEIEALGGWVEAALADLGLSEKLLEWKAVLAWKEVVGPEVAEKAQPLRMNKGRLEVAVPSAVWRTQINFAKKDLIERINQQLGREVVKQLILLNKS